MAGHNKAVLDALAIPSMRDDSHFSADELWIDAGEQTSSVHLAFQAKDRAAVHGFYRAGLDTGGKDNGKPGAELHRRGQSLLESSAVREAVDRVGRIQIFAVNSAYWGGF